MYRYDMRDIVEAYPQSPEPLAALGDSEGRGVKNIGASGGIAVGGT
jgi:hypothetical protein